jgi:cytoskeletal protein CcmA (bactofilin family)
MFEKEKKFKPEEAETIIGAGVKVEGTFIAFGNVIVKGQVSGSIETKNDLKVEEGALIEADVKTKNAYVAGEIKGNLKAEEKVSLAATAKITGDISCKTLGINEGAIFNGRCSMGEQVKPEK